jgi:hypothetical protein
VSELAKLLQRADNALDAALYVLGMLMDYPRCAYCGVPVKTQAWKRKPVTCKCHADLPAVDPFYAVPDQWEAARK